MDQPSGRDKEATMIMQANRAAAVGRLMLGEMNEVEESPIAKLVEEMKALPSRIAERLAESDDPSRRRRRRFHPMMLEDILHMSGKLGDPVGILLAASMIRDDAPWLYELEMEVYRAAKSGDTELIKYEINRITHFSEYMMHGPFMDEFGGGKDAYMFCREFPRMLNIMLQQTMKEKKPQPKRRTLTEKPSQS